MLAFASPTPDATPVWLVSAENWPTVKSMIGAAAEAFAERCGFQPKAGRMQLLPGEAGALAGVLFGVDEANAPTRDPFGPGKLRRRARRRYRFANPPQDTELAALGFLLALYRYDRFKAEGAKAAPRRARRGRRDPDTAHRRGDHLRTRSRQHASQRPGPNALEQEAVKLAEHFDASVTMVRGDELIGANFPLIHAVGHAGAEEPRIVDFSWGREDAPKVAIIGKGVTFDSGGLDIKPASGMELMKKDMGGAATALTLARMIMEAGLDLRLRTLIPIVENAISAPAMRPGDVIVSRKGISVEVGNTDAEGRMILADALALADEDAPELMFDFATLTGAARVALGPDLPPFYTDDERSRARSPPFRARARSALAMPLWRPYDAMIEGSVADISNSGSGAGMAGSITAALFLRRFVDKAKSWAHFDVYAWNPKPRAHGPIGGEIQAARALFELLSERYPRR